MNLHIRDVERYPVVPDAVEDALGDDLPRAHTSDSRPTPECLVKRLPQVRRYLSRRPEKFSPWVIELALDRVVRAALPYIDEDGKRDCKLDDRTARERWLFRLALKAARQVASRQAKYVMLEPDKLAAVARPLTEDSEPDPLIGLLHVAVGLLTDLQWQALDLCVVRGMTYQEAAELMECTAKTVEYHRNAALTNLRRLLSTDFSVVEI